MCSRAKARTLDGERRDPVQPGDIVLIPPNEKHMTRNTGTEPLVLLCFFPTPDVAQVDRRFASCSGNDRHADRGRSACARKPISRASMRCRRLRCRCAIARRTIRRCRRISRPRRALVIPAVGPKLPPALFEDTALKLVQVTGAGVDRLDPAALIKAGNIPVANVPGGSNNAIAEYVMTTASMLLRRLAWADAEIKAGHYANCAPA